MYFNVQTFFGWVILQVGIDALTTIENGKVAAIVQFQ